MRNRYFVLGLIAVGLGVVALASPAYAGAFTDKGSFNIGPVDVSYHVMVHRRFDKSGGSHFNLNWNFQARGVIGGTKLTGKFSRKVSFQNKSGPGFTRIAINKLVLNPQGSGPKLTITFKSKITMNANGDVVVVFFDFS